MTIIASVAKRFHVEQVRVGRQILVAEESRHAHTVMRLRAGDAVEVFDAAGAWAAAAIVASSPEAVEVEVAEVQAAPAEALKLSVASAVPKGQRADWLVEKLAEVGVDEFVPLQTARSVVHPEGAGKLQRWERLAAEAAKQSRRIGSMLIRPLTPLSGFLNATPRPLWHFSTAGRAAGLAMALAAAGSPGQLALLIGPEGGWSAEEEAQLEARGSQAVALTASILRIETAGIVAAGAVRSFFRAP